MLGFSNRRIILEEEDYVEALERIIERTFFPDLPRLKRQTMWIEHMAKQQPERLASLNSHLFDGTSTETNEEDGTSSMTLGSFLATHTSEDNASFSNLLEKDQAAHRRRYHWAYGDEKTQVETKLSLMLKDGTRWSAAERAEFDAACASKNGLIEDSRPTNLDTWKYAAQNTLMFPPSQVIDTKSEVKRIEAASAASANLPRVGNALSEAKEIVYQNSRFQPAIAPDNVLETKHIEQKPKRYEYVPMTPSIEVDDAEPIMTWGKVEGTPIVLNEQKPAFGIAPRSVREQIASKLESKASNAGIFNSKKRTATTLRRNYTGDHSNSSIKRKRQLTPAGHRLASRLAGATPLRSDLRAAYQKSSRAPSSRNGSRKSSGRKAQEDNRQVPENFSTSGLLND